ncbi:MAG TPA: hypothetical protein VIK99_05395 [Thermaerobacter sp.]
MDWAAAGPWIGLMLLGAYHGINPAMGWLFAVALGLQERSRRRVVGALLPIAAGHALSVALVLALLWGARWLLPEGLVRGLVAAVLIGYGGYHLVRARHPHWAGMRVGFRDLVFWSFLMATAHGAGLMLAPLLWVSNPAAGGHGHADQLGHGGHGVPGGLAGHEHGHAVLGSLLSGALGDGAAGVPGLLVAAVAVHTLSMLAVAGAVALIVYERLGLQLLRRAWINLDWVWSLALIVSGIALIFWA